MISAIETHLNQAMSRGRGRSSRNFNAQGNISDPLARLYQALETLTTVIATNHGSGLGKSMIERFLQMKPPIFLGTHEPLVAEDWLERVERMLRILRCSEEEWVEMATFLLYEGARHWWSAAKRNIPETEHPIQWTRFVNLFFKKYFTEAQKRKKEVEFLELVQGSMFVSQYEEMFTQLSRFTPRFAEEEEWQVRRFELELRPNIRRFVAPHKLRTHAYVLERALMVESEHNGFLASQGKEILGKRKTRPKNNELQKDLKNPSRKERMIEKIEVRVQDKSEKITCRRCGRVGHIEKDCYTNRGACYKCGQKGHLMGNCPIVKPRQEKVDGKRPAV